jgi:hypothetical protein
LNKKMAKNGREYVSSLKLVKLKSINDALFKYIKSYGYPWFFAAVFISKYFFEKKFIAKMQAL